MELPEPLGWNLEDIYYLNNQILFVDQEYFIFDLPIIHKYKNITA